MIEHIKEKLEAGERLDSNDALALFATDEIHLLGQMAAARARKLHAGKAYYVRNIHINPTNICVNRCKFCAFSRSSGDEGAYEMSIAEVIESIRSAMPVEEVHMVGGLHPDWAFEHHLDMVSEIRSSFPGVHIKAFTAAEIDYFARISGLEVLEVLGRLMASGLDAMPGGGAEIFAPEVRGRLCPEKLTGERWLDIMEQAHSIGVRSNATMLYGHVEGPEHRVDHLMRLRDLQDRTGGFQAFIPLSYHPGNTEIGGTGVSGLEDLRTVAVSRLVLDNFEHIKAYWVMMGEKIAQLALAFGADDLDGTIVNERITHATSSGDEDTRRGITEQELRHMIERAGFVPVRRDALYGEVA